MRTHHRNQRRITDDPPKLFVLKKGYIRRHISDWDLLILQNSRNQVVSLNEDASHILQFLSEPISEAQLYEAVSDAGNRISMDKLTSFLDQLLDVGVLDYSCEP